MNYVNQEPDTAYWQSRVMRHRSRVGADEYAVHEVYFDHEHRPVAWTEGALSPRLQSPKALKEWIVCKLQAPDEGVVCGDRGYTYHHGDFEMWLKYIEEPPLEYSEEQAAASAFAGLADRG